MHRRVASILITGFLFLSVVASSGCRRSTATTLPVVTGTSAQAHPVNTGTLLPYPQSTNQLGTPARSEGSPQTTTQGSKGSTAYPYPQNTTESATAIPAETTQPAYPAAITSPTSAVTPSPKASATQIKLTATQTSTRTARPTATMQATASRTPTATGTMIPESGATETSPYPGPGEAGTQQFPGPGEGGTEQYPSPGETATELFPGPEVSYTPSITPGKVPFTPAPSPTRAYPTLITSTLRPSPTLAFGTGTPVVTPTERPPGQPLAPPPAGSNVNIWYSWVNSEQVALRSIIQSFQRLYPNVTFTLMYLPLDDLFPTYQQAAYLGQGPTLLLGPAKWGPELFDDGLITDLNPSIPAAYLSRINPAALDSAKYRQALISLPVSQSGVVMFRNTSLIAKAPSSFSDLIIQSHAATRAGIVGSYLDRGAYFSSANVLGLNGSLMDENGLPTFDNQPGLDWVDLLAAFGEAGAVTFNTNWDVVRFTRGRIGIIIDGTWDIQALRNAIGSENLAIDPWPTYENGHMSGWVQADSVFLNANINGNDRFAALSFIGYLLDPQVQLRLAEVGHIPSVTSTHPRDPLLQQAMDAFLNGVPYPITVNDDELNIYWKALDTAIQSIFVKGINPENALQSASNEIRQAIQNSTATP